jgi:hypothetical protein
MLASRIPDVLDKKAISDAAPDVEGIILGKHSASSSRPNGPEPSARNPWPASFLRERPSQYGRASGASRRRVSR